MQALIQFVTHLISVAIIAVILVWVFNRFSKKPKYHVTYEFKLYDVLMCDFKTYWTEEEQERVQKKLDESWNGLAELGKQGWKIVGINQTLYSGIEYILQRETVSF